MLLPVDFRVGQPAEPIDPNNPQWATPLPLQRPVGLTHQWPNPSRVAVTYGDYFTAIHNFLIRKGKSGLARLAAAAARHPVEPYQIQRATIHLIKHGAFYHPALVHLHTGSEEIPLILNVAVSQAGRETLPAEYRHLKQLFQRFPQAFIPRVLDCGCGADAAGRQLEIFAAQWLADFHELHPTAGSSWTVWDTERGSWRLSPSQVSAFHEQAAYILTYYYNPLTFEAILDWHLAAGDFVIRQDRGRIAVRLITVRRYAPLFALESHTQPNLQAVLDGLVIFLLHTSLHLRLDRLDGTGELVWSPDHVLPAIWQGFRHGLESLAELHRLPPEFIQGTHQYLAAHGEEGLARLVEQMRQRQVRQTDTAAMLSCQGPAHAAELGRIIRDTA